MLDKELAARASVGSGLIEHEAQRAHIGSVARAATSVQKFHISVLEEPELEALRGIVYLCRDHRILKLQLIGKSVVHIE